MVGCRRQLNVKQAGYSDGVLNSRIYFESVGVNNESLFIRLYFQKYKQKNCSESDQRNSKISFQQ